MVKKKQVHISTPVKDQKLQKGLKHKVIHKTETQLHKQAPPTRETKLKIKQEKQKKQLTVFTQKFYHSLHNFQQIYKEFLNTKHSYSQNDIENQMKQVTGRVSNQIQIQALSIFKHQLQDLQNQIVQEIKKIHGEVESIEKVYQQNRKSLLETGAFTEDEVKKQLAPIQAKAALKRQQQESFDNLLKKSKSIYEQSQ